MCSIFCSKVAQKGTICSRLLEPQKVAANAKSCSNVAKHNRERPNMEYLPPPPTPLNKNITYFFLEQRDWHKIPKVHLIQYLYSSLCGIYNLTLQHLLDFERCKCTCTLFLRLYL